MKYKYTKTVEVSIEGELPLLGYDIKEAVDKIYTSEINEAIRIGIGDGREEQKITIGRNTYTITIGDSLHSISHNEDEKR